MAQVEKGHQGRNQALVVSTIHEEPFPLPYYCGICDLPRVASVVPTNDLSQGVIFQQNNTPTQHTTDTRVAAVV
jgi:hypothetical protein